SEGLLRRRTAVSRQKLPQVELFHLVAQGIAGDAQQARRLRLVALGLLQSAHQQAAFVVFEGESAGGDLAAGGRRRQWPAAVPPRHGDRGLEGGCVGEKGKTRWWPHQ